MATNTTNPTRRATSAHRTQIVTEAVISAYIHEISPTERPRAGAGARHGRMEFSPRAIATPSRRGQLGRVRSRRRLVVA